MKHIFVFYLGWMSCFSMAQMPNEKRTRLEEDFFDLNQNNQDEIIKTGNKLLQNVQSEEVRSRILGIMAVAYFEKEDLNKSTELFFEAKNEAEKTKNPELIAKTYGSVAHQFIHLKLNDKAKSYLDQAIDQIEKMPAGNSKNLLKGLSYLDLGNIEFDAKDYKSANQQYKQSLVHFKQMNEPGKQFIYHYRRSLYNIGNSFYYLDQTDSTEIYLSNALQLKDDKNIGLTYFITNSLALVYQKKGWNQRAIDSLEIVLNDPNFDNLRLKAEIYLNLSRNYQKINDSRRYQFYNEKYLHLNDSLQFSGLNAINSAINAEQKDFALALAESDKSNRNQFWVGILILLILVGIIGFLFYKRRKEKIIFENLVANLKRELNQKEVQTEKFAKVENSSIPISVEDDILLKLGKFEKSNKFTNSKLTISTVAVQLKTNTTYLSEIINSHKGKNFNTYINELRIHYICEKIYNQPEYLHYKISYLAEVAGFASHSAFATVFKSVTGISPSVFLREAAKIESYKPKANK